MDMKQTSNCSGFNVTMKMLIDKVIAFFVSITFPGMSSEPTFMINVILHFHGPGHNGLRDVSVQIIDKVHNNEKLFIKEGEWAYRLQTLKPEGLNDSDFFYSQNRVTRNR